MSQTAEQSSQTTAVHIDNTSSMSLIAWRSIAISVVIAIVFEVLFIVIASHLHIRLYDAPQWQNDALNWLMEHHGVLPICVGGLYLAFKVRQRWILQSAIYISLFMLLAILPLIAREYAAAVNMVAHIVPCYLVLSVMRWLVNKYFTREHSLQASSEKIRFGFTTVFWGSTLVAVLVSLLIWTLEAMHASDEERLAKIKAKYEETERLDRIASAQSATHELVELGGVYDKASEHITFRPKASRPLPVDMMFYLLIRELGEITSIEFIDCEVTDETIAELQEARARHQPFKVSFVNCTVIKDFNPSGKVSTKKVKLGPLSGDLP